MKKLLLLLIIVVIAVAGWRIHTHQSTSPAALNSAATTAIKAAAAAESASRCASNTTSKEIIVSISAQHLWACTGPVSAYDSAVITGMQLYPSELTPVGTYKIYAKQTNQSLAGHDFTGSWDDFVYYWLPFLNNQYGTYGFHDLTQTKNGANGRADSDFGNININAPYTAAKHGSHGCVEMPLTAAHWLYDWSAVGTKVSIVS